MLGGAKRANGRDTILPHSSTSKAYKKFTPILGKLTFGFHVNRALENIQDQSLCAL